MDKKEQNRETQCDKKTEKKIIMKSIFISLLLSIAEANDDIEVNMTPGGLPGMDKRKTGFKTK